MCSTINGQASSSSSSSSSRNCSDQSQPNLPTPPNSQHHQPHAGCMLCGLRVGISASGCHNSSSGLLRRPLNSNCCAARHHPSSSTYRALHITPVSTSSIQSAAVAQHSHEQEQTPTDTGVQKGPALDGTSVPRGSARRRRNKAAAAASDAGKVLRALCQYAPIDLADGPASLSKVRPYNATEVQQALDHAQRVLPRMGLQQLSNLTGALAAAGHLDHGFMQQLGDAAAARLQAVPKVVQHTQGLRAFRIICWLAVGFSRLGVLHVGLMEQVAVYATHLLQRCPLQFSKRRHGHQIALLAAAFAALKLYPPQLYKALAEHLKQHRHVLKLLGPQESMLLLWALARVGHRDAPAQLLITQRATTQVGQLTCQGLAHAYSHCAAVNITAAPLLSALRKATRVKLHSMQPADLTALLTALAALGQQDLLYLDEIARAVFDKLANFTAAEISSSMVALAALRYRNPWLLDQTSKMLVSRRMRKAHQLTAEQLADLLQACCGLGYMNPLLLSHLGSVAVEAQLPGCTPAQLLGVTQGFRRLGFQQPQLLLAAATRLLQLAAAAAVDGQGGGAIEDPLQDTRGQPLGSPGSHALPEMIAAALQLASMPSAAGTSAERAILPTALLAITAATLGSLATQQQQQGLRSVADATSTGSSSSSSSSGSACSVDDLVALHTAIVLCVTGAISDSGTLGAAAQHPAAVVNSQGEQGQLQAAEVLQELVGLQQHLQQHLVVAVPAAVAAAEPGGCPAGLLQLLQLLWLQEQAHAAHAAPAAAVLPDEGDVGLHTTTTGWRLGLTDERVEAIVQQHLQQLGGQQQQQQQQGHVRLQQQSKVLAAVANVCTRALQQQQQPGLALQQAQQGGKQVQVLHRIPNSPVVVPVAVLPDADVSSIPPDEPAVGSAGARFVSVEMPLRQRKLVLPPAAQQLLGAEQQQQQHRPLAVFPVLSGADRAAGAAFIQGWHTCNAPQQLLPAGWLWQQGLQAAGWDVLVLCQDEAVDED